MGSGDRPVSIPTFCFGRCIPDRFFQNRVRLCHALAQLEDWRKRPSRIEAPAARLPRETASMESSRVSVGPISHSVHLLGIDEASQAKTTRHREQIQVVAMKAYFRHIYGNEDYPGVARRSLS